MKFGLLGKSLKHSYSSDIHKMLSDNSYEMFERDNLELERFFKDREFKGINVTLPYKEEVIKYLDDIDDEAKAIGAINAIVNNNGKLKGYNTDAFGFEKMLWFHKIDVKNKKVLILGSGGTSKTVKHVLLKLGAKEIYIVSRTPNKGQISYANAIEKFETQIIVNTTPYGMYPDYKEESLIDVNKFPYLEAVVDVIYRPYRTNLLIDAKLKGCKTASGLYMLVAQAIKASELFLDRVYDRKVYRQVYFELLRKTTNIVLIGMPSTGKTTAARNLSKSLNMVYYDTDFEIINDVKLTITEIFEQYGEEYFRKLETNKIKDLMKQSGIIISTGGGAILKEENRYEILRNGYVIYLNRNISLLKKNKRSLKHRPLLQNAEAFDELYKKRSPLYKACCDLEYCNNSTQWNTLNYILKQIV